MKPIDNDFERQFTAVKGYGTYFVADMHELANPNDSARRLNEAMQQRTLSDGELVALYENCEDPLVLSLEQVQHGNGTVVISLGDMVANRINFGEGTDKSIVGKMAKKAREAGIPQHVYIADNIEANRQELQEYAHRNNLWTLLRFKALDDLLSGHPNTTFVHLNGNADVMSSFVSERILPEESTPMQTFEASTAVKRYYKEKPGMLIIHDNFEDDIMDAKGYQSIVIPQSLDFGSMLVPLRELQPTFRGYIIGVGNIKIEEPDDLTASGLYRYCFCGTQLLIHEALRPDLCAKAQSVEGMAVYEEALKIWNVKRVVHGHTHNPEIVKYQHGSSIVYQIPPNKRISEERLV